LKATGINIHSRADEGVTVGSYRINHLLFVDDLMLFASSEHAFQHPLDPGPSPEFRNQEGPKVIRGSTFFKYNNGCMQQPGTKYEIGGPGTTGPPAGDGPAFIGFQLCAIKRE